MEWQVKKLGDVCRIIGGGTPSKSNESFYEGDIPWATVRDMRDSLLSNTQFKITNEAVEKSSTNIIPSGTIIIATRVGLGKVCILQQDTAINQDLKGVIPKTAGLDNSFLYWWLRSVAHVIVAAGTGATVQGVRMSFINSLKIPLPPIPEQKRIVAILDEAFADIEQVRAKTEQNLKNARELFESYLQQVFSQRGEGWVEEKLVNCFKLRSGDGLTAKNMVEGPYPVYGGNGIAGMHNNFNLSEESIIIGRVGALCGNARHITEKIWLTDNAFKITQFQHEFDYVFLTYLLNFKNLRSLARQAAQPVISNSSLSGLLLAFPSSLPEQKKLALEITKLEEQVISLENIYSDKLNYLGELKKSILQKAFSGELTQKNTQGAVA